MTANPSQVCCISFLGGIERLAARFHLHSIYTPFYGYDPPFFVAYDIILSVLERLGKKNED